MSSILLMICISNIPNIGTVQKFMFQKLYYLHIPFQILLALRCISCIDAQLLIKLIHILGMGTGLVVLCVIGSVVAVILVGVLVSILYNHCVCQKVNFNAPVINNLFKFRS